MKQLAVNDIPKFEYEDDYGFLESAWIGHRYFIYDLISDLNPRIVVELGTHHGGSFFSMAQAVKDFKLSTKLYAVDTWQGDKHAGFYGDKIYLKVKKIKNKIYKNVDISLLKKSFDEAVGDFRKNSIDILHIDGLHTYEAVKHDFDTWMPKVKKDGIILFHDVFEKQKDFGVWKLWEELKKKYDYFEFVNFHGLGLIFKGKKTFSFDDFYQNYYKTIIEFNRDYQDKLKTKNKIKQLQGQVDDLNGILNTIRSAKTFKVWQLIVKLRNKFKKKYVKKTQF